MKIAHGITRTVFLIGGLAFKFPSVRNGTLNFIEGMRANYKERQFYLWEVAKFKAMPKIERDYYFIPLAKSYFCGWLGLFSIQERVKVKKNPLTEQELKRFEGITTETKPVNFGYNSDWSLVCLDYPS